MYWYGDLPAFEIAKFFDITYLFPLFGGIAALIGVLIVFFSPKNRTIGILLQFFGLGIGLMFLFGYLANNFQSFMGAQIGVYAFLTGMFITFFEVIWALTQAAKKGENCLG